MSIARLINRDYQIEELFGEVELAVAQLVDENFSDEVEDRQQALMRLLFMISEVEEGRQIYVLNKALDYAFRHVPQHRRAMESYLRELTGKGKKKRRRKPPQTAGMAKG